MIGSPVSAPLFSSNTTSSAIFRRTLYLGDHTITLNAYPNHVTARLDATDMTTIRDIHRIIRPGKVTSFTDVLRFLLSEWRKAHREGASK